MNSCAIVVARGLKHTLCYFYAQLTILITMKFFICASNYINEQIYVKVQESMGKSFSHSPMINKSVKVCII